MLSSAPSRPMTTRRRRRGRRETPRGNSPCRSAQPPPAVEIFRQRLLGARRRNQRAGVVVAVRAPRRSSWCVVCASWSISRGLPPVRTDRRAAAPPSGPATAAAHKLSALGTASRSVPSTRSAPSGLPSWNRLLRRQRVRRGGPRRRARRRAGPGSRKSAFGGLPWVFPAIQLTRSEGAGLSSW
jgi:hypothetical protein